jgi:membrane fusion protein, multidrug efflux system
MLLLIPMINQVVTIKNLKDMNKLIIISLVLLQMACGEKKNVAIDAKPSDSVEVLVLKKQPVVKALTLPAELHPWERAEIYAKLEGYVKTLKVDIGDKVKRNEILVIIDAPEVAANYSRSSADIQSAEAKFRTSKDAYKRIVKASAEQGAISASELERARNQMLSDSAAFVSSKSNANSFSQLQDYLIIRAAFDGVITARNIDPGSLVGKGQKPMFVLENISRLRLRVAIPETYTTALPDTSVISFTVSAQPNKKYSARLARKSNQIDSKTRTELWEFEVNNSKGDLKSGMYGNANFNLQRGESSFVIPYSSLVTNQERNFVIRVRDGKTEWVDVKNGISLKEQIEVFGDLSEGDQIVRRANDEIKADQKVIGFSKN